MKTIAFASPFRYVGKGTSVYHIGCILAEQGRQVVIVDMNPQCTVTRYCVDDKTIENAHKSGNDVLNFMVKSDSDCQPIKLRENMALIPGALMMATQEDYFNGIWNDSVRAGQNQEIKDLQLFDKLKKLGANIILIDLPNSGLTALTKLVGASVDLDLMVVVTNTSNFVQANTAILLMEEQLRQAANLRKLPPNPTYYIKTKLKAPKNQQSKQEPKSEQEPTTIHNYLYLPEEAKQMNKPIFELETPGAAQFLVRLCRTDFEKVTAGLMRRLDPRPSTHTPN